LPIRHLCISATSKLQPRHSTRSPTAGIRSKRNTSLAQAYKDNLVLDYAGVPASQLNKQQKALLLELIAEYVGNMKEGHARVRMEEVRRHLDRTYFAWIGSANPE
jgi:hypothetical protein